MVRVSWPTGAYTEGLDCAVLYLDGVGVPWTGLVSVAEKSDMETDSELYFDGYASTAQQTHDDCGLTIQALTFPEEFESYLGLDGRSFNQPYGEFGFTCRTYHESGYKLHLMYNCVATLESVPAETDSTDVGLEPFRLVFDTVPEIVTENYPSGHPRIMFHTVEPSAHLVVDSAVAHPEALKDLEDLLYGTESSDPEFPTPEELIAIFEEYATFVVVDNLDGTWTATGPEGSITMLDSDTFEIDSSAVTVIADDAYVLRTW